MSQQVRTVVSEPPSLVVLRAHRADILRIAASHGASNVRVYGSVARGDAGADSDVDLLVDFQDGRSLLDEVELQRELTALLGWPVDLGEQVHRAIRSRVSAETVPL